VRLLSIAAARYRVGQALACVHASAWRWRVVGLGVQMCQVTSLVVAVAVQPLWWAIV
jgi:hypothetical protein